MVSALLGLFLQRQHWHILGMCLGPSLTVLACFYSELLATGKEVGLNISRGT